MPPPERNGTLAYRVDRLERDEGEQDNELRRLNDKLDKLILTVLGAALTMFVSVTVFVVTLLMESQ